jgi:hypothetical protein
MKHVSIRQVGGSLYFRIPSEWVRANDLRNNDLAFLTPVPERKDEFKVKLVKLPVPQEAASRKRRAKHPKKDGRHPVSHPRAAARKWFR